MGPVTQVLLLAACISGSPPRPQAADAQSAGANPASAATDLGVWSRFLETSWKEYGLDGAVRDVLFDLTAPDVVTVTIRADRELRGRTIFRLKGNRTGRVCRVTKGEEVCDASMTFDDRSVSYSFDDPKRLPERAVLVDPDTFVHSREVEGVKFDVETYASDAFDRNPAVRQRARDSMERYKRGTEEVKRRRAAR